MVPVCATATGTWGQQRGHQVTAAFAGCWLHGCCAVLSNDQQETTAGQLGFVLSFLGGPLLHLTQSICLVPLESRHCPQVIFLLKHSRKARGF